MSMLRLEPVASLDDIDDLFDPPKPEPPPPPLLPAAPFQSSFVQQQKLNPQSSVQQPSTSTCGAIAKSIAGSRTARERKKPRKYIEECEAGPTKENKPPTTNRQNRPKRNATRRSVPKKSRHKSKSKPAPEQHQQPGDESLTEKPPAVPPPDILDDNQPTNNPLPPFVEKGPRVIVQPAYPDIDIRLSAWALQPQLPLNRKTLLPREWGDIPHGADPHEQCESTALDAAPDDENAEAFAAAALAEMSSEDMQSMCAQFSFSNF